ncbi:quinon protein alcohol dehydrogenase-like superfamily [Entophlyctis helioformis]|nr:quinon protein alcohol dehydrogenase-like superfamily [Entophlyctis helioformis]
MDGSSSPRVSRKLYGQPQPPTQSLSKANSLSSTVSTSTPNIATGSSRGPLTRGSSFGLAKVGIEGGPQASRKPATDSLSRTLASKSQQQQSSEIGKRVGSQTRLSVADNSNAKRTTLDGEESEREPRTSGLLKWRFTKKIDTEIYSTKFSPDEEYIALGCGDSRIMIFSTKTNAKETEFKTDNGVRVPCTSLAFRPNSAAYKNKNVLVATCKSYADGSIRHWHYTSGQLLSTVSEGDNQINTVAYSNDGSLFVTGGSDMNARVYDGETHKNVFSVFAGIFCAKFHPRDRNMIISGGWDNTLQIWDQRVNYSVRSIYGPHICGDSIDFDDTGDRVLTGSYSKDDPLQLWSWKSGEVVGAFPWAAQSAMEGEMPMCMLGSVKEVRVFATESKRHVGSVTNLNCAVYSVAMSSQDRMVAFGGGGKTLIVMDVEEQSAESR